VFRGLIVSERVCFFAHYDPNNVVAPHVIRYLEHLRSSGFSIIFVSTSVLDRGQLDDVERLCQGAFVRPNVGHDFGSWAYAYDLYGHALTGDLLLANDSVYGPLGSIGQALDRLCAVQADFYGMVESVEYQSHLQSWFLLFTERVHQSEAFRAVFSQSFVGLSKLDVIKQGEIGLTQSLCRAGFTYHALSRVSTMGPMMRRFPGNPGHWLWRRIVEEDHVPFLKVELLRDNPLGLPIEGAWEPFVKELAPDLYPMIAEHLRRVQVHKEPPASLFGHRFLVRLRMACYQPRTGVLSWIAYWFWIGLMVTRELVLDLRVTCRNSRSL
jgi:lipopolysaccharide biosynthesis protein